MAHKTLSPLPLPGLTGCPDPVLERPSRLKAWAETLTPIIKEQAGAIFAGYSFEGEKLTTADLGRILGKIDTCATILELRAPVCKCTGEVGPAKLHAGNFCGQHTICPTCAGRIQDRRGAKWEKPIKWAAEKYVNAYMLTATINPDPTWRGNFNSLLRTFRQFYLKGQKRKGKSGSGEWGKIRAGLAKVELKRGQGGDPHCHIHMLVFSNERLDYKIWSDSEKKISDPEMRIPLRMVPVGNDWVVASKLTYEWWEASGGQAINFDVSPVRYLQEHKDKGLTRSESIQIQSQEVLKYATKFDSNPKRGTEKLFAADFIGIRCATYQRRLFFTYGAFHRDSRKAAADLCPCLDDGDDFTGGGAHISTAPQIYESRWASKRYSDLMPRSKPVFVGLDMSLRVQYRITMLNRLQGKIRRVRRAILESKDAYRVTGMLQPAFYEDIDYLENGDVVKTPVAMECPAYLVANPSDFSNWEKWTDHVTEKGRVLRGELAEFLALDDLQRFDARWKAKEFQLYWENRSREYRESVVKVFIKTINESRSGP